EASIVSPEPGTLSGLKTVGAIAQRMSQMGHRRSNYGLGRNSNLCTAYPSAADLARWLRPIHALCQEETHANTKCHSISSSEGGTVRPSALAVLRLMTSSNLVGNSTGKSPGLLPFKILST